MKSAVSSLASDGLRHIWDAANRGGTPVCGAGVVLLADSRPALACWRCMERVYAIVRRRQRGR